VAAVDALPEREATVVRLRFGLAGIAPHELAEIGAIIGVSKQRVEAILKQALATLRRSVEPTLKAGA
jgi:RNA polymerase primary sigma factor